MISIIFFALAAICNACMDDLLFRFGWSVFKNHPNWNPVYSSQHSKTIGGWKFDAWHVFQSLMILFCALAAIFNYLWWPHFITGWMKLIIYVVVWSTVKPFAYGRFAPKPKTIA
jgi:hypothetical protein